MTTDTLAAILSAPAEIAARRLLGARLLVGGVGGLIVETEAYTVDDPASHAFRGRTNRNAVMFGPIGRAYVYRIYGLHWCLNVVCNAASQGSAVLIRALEPTDRLDTMRERRGVADIRKLCSGPGRLCQALGVTGDLNGAPVDATPFQLDIAGPVEAVTGTRIGLTRGVDAPWRFGVAGSRFLSRPFAAA